MLPMKVPMYQGLYSTQQSEPCHNRNARYTKAQASTPRARRHNKYQRGWAVRCPTGKITSASAGPHAAHPALPAPVLPSFHIRAKRDRRFRVVPLSLIKLANTSNTPSQLPARGGRRQTILRTGHKQPHRHVRATSSALRHKAGLNGTSRTDLVGLPR